VRDVLGGSGVTPANALSITPRETAVLAFDRRQHGTFRQSFERYDYWE
jgi:hypothetical protein